ncbi:unnamed protein product [Brassica rapa subsp. narinosa]
MDTMRDKPIKFSSSVFCLIILLSVYNSTAELRRLVQPPKSDGTLSFLVVGDWGRRGSYNQSQVARQMGKTGMNLNIDFVISTGDNFYDDGITSPYDCQFQDSFTNIYTAPSLQKPWYNVLGNHDYRGNVDAQISPILKDLDCRWVCLRSYVVNADIVDIFFIDTTPFVDKYFDEPKDHVYDWSGVLPRNKYLNNLLADLDVSFQESVAKWKVVVGHHTIKSAGHHGITKELEKQLLPILEANEVDLYINGHDHCLEHISSINSKSCIVYLISLKTQSLFNLHNQRKQLRRTKMKMFSVRLIFLILCIFFDGSLSKLERLEHPVTKSDGSLNILVVGDWGRQGCFNQSLVAHQMGIVGEQLDIDYVISVGDNFYDDGLKGDTDPAFEASFSHIYTHPSLQKQWYSVLGNHDYRGNVSAQLSHVLTQKDWRWFCRRSFVLCSGMVELFFVDTNPFVEQYFTDPEDHTYDWSNVLPRDRYISNLLHDLDLAMKKSRATWKFVVGHHGIKTAGEHGVTQELVDQLLPILEENKVDVYMNGHDHCLQHIGSDGGIQFLTSGGGSKAWRGVILPWDPKELKLYYDGQGFMSLHITHSQAKFIYYDISGNRAVEEKKQRMVVLGIQSLNWYVHGGFMEKKKKHLNGIVRATERDDSSSQRFEIDRDKARQALKQLDQQIESQADEKPRTFVKTSSDVVRTSSGGSSSMDPFMFEEPPEMSGSFLTTTAFLLLAFTLFYNILFFTVIKPSMDGPESVPADTIIAMSDSELVQFPLSSSPKKNF